MSKHVAIIGSGHAGVQAAASLREEGFDGRITLIGDEADMPYHKPPLSKAFLKDADARSQPLRGDAFYTGAAIDLILGQRVERIDTLAKQLYLVSGKALPFDDLILATGSRPRELPEGLRGIAGVLSLRSLGDARAIRALKETAEDVVVLGGGFIGLEIAATLAAAGARVTVVEFQERLLGRVVAPLLSGHVRNRLVGAGVRILTTTAVESVEVAGGHVKAVQLSNGERVPAGMLIVGIGVVPNTELAASAGLAIDNGIRVDSALRTSAPRILAIGDVASYTHFSNGQDVRLESVQNATDQARLAARIILGHEGAYSSVPWFWSDIGDMKLQMVGLTTGSDRQIVAGTPDDNKFSIFHYIGDRLIAIESVNRPTDHMLGRRMLATGFSPLPETVETNPDGLKEVFQTWQKEQL